MNARITLSPTRTRESGGEQGGLHWGPFTTRIPCYHTRVEWPELLQGLLVGSVTGIACIPILTGYLGLSFGAAVAFLILQSVLIASATIVFGEPLAPGWMTPAFPLVLALLESTTGGATDRLHVMTALGIVFATLVGVLGMSGLGQWFIERLPCALKAGILMGAGLVAYKRVFIDDHQLFFGGTFWSTTIAITISLVVAFSAPFKKWASRKKTLAPVIRLGLLPGFIGAGLTGPLVGEFSYGLDTSSGFIFPSFGTMFQSVSPFIIGWPSFGHYVAVLPLALIAYTLLFSDMVTGNEILRSAQSLRPDESIPISVSRTHLSVAARNLVSALICPLFSTQGCLWTAAHIIVIERWKRGRQEMDSLFGGLSSYYVLGVPLLYFVIPLVLVLKPLAIPALAMTLVLTGYACTSLALSIPRSPSERGAAVLTAVLLAIFPVWAALLLGVVVVGVLGDWTRDMSEKRLPGDDREAE